MITILMRLQKSNKRNSIVSWMTHNTELHYKTYKSYTFINELYFLIMLQYKRNEAHAVKGN